MTRKPITITLNGAPHELPAPMPLAALLDSLGLGGRPVVVELDEAAVLARDYPLTTISDRARVEIVTLAAGG